MSRDAEIIDYLLGELPAPDRERLEARMAADPRVRREVERMRAVVSGLEALPDEVWAPGRVPPLPSLPAAAPPARAPRAVRPLVAVAAALAALAVGIGLGALIGGGGDGAPGGPAIALERLSDAAPGARGEARMTGDDSAMRLTVSGLRPSDEDGFYELWLLGSDGGMVSLGAFRVPPSGSAEVSVPLPADPSAFDHIDVSREPADGDPAHSGASVLRGGTPSA